MLREYLESEFGILRPILGNYYDFERIIDDVIFLLFFVGNDFLPHLPCLSIREGAIGLLFNIYMNLLPKLDGYLTEDGGRLNLTRIYYIFKELSKYEDEILRRRLYIALFVCERGSENQVQMDMQRNKKKQAQNIFGCILIFLLFYCIAKPEETKLIEAKKEEVKETQEKTEETAKKDTENEPSNDPEDMFNSIEKELEKEMDEHALSKKYCSFPSLNGVDMISSCLTSWPKMLNILMLLIMSIPFFLVHFLDQAGYYWLETTLLSN